ncbi:MAG: thiolase family protein [Acetobacteraceae bacterium]
MQNIVIAGYARSPFTPARKGELARVRPDDLAAQVVRALIERTGVKPEDIEDVIMGCAFPEGEQGMNVGRLVALLADLPISVAGMTVNRFCGSSMQSVHIAGGAIAMGAGEVFICAGVESMSRVPIGGYNPLFNPVLNEKQPGAYMSMGDTAENVARQWQISRAEQEAFAVRSHQRAAAALAAGYFADEIVAIRNGKASIAADGCIRSDTSAEVLAGLKPAFDKDGSVTAGTSSPLTDGCAAVLVTTEAYAERNGLTPLARLRSVAVAGCGPAIMGIGPIAASKKALARAGIEIGAVDVVELNEAFSSQALASARDIGIRDETLNIDGGALAIGHPLGATGARIVGKAASLLARTGGRYALATQCIGGGQGIATVLERV